jgi:hypothetical protein
MIMHKKQAAFQKKSCRRYFFQQIYIFIISAILFPLLPSYAVELRGDISVEGRYFIEEPGNQDQEQHSGSLAIEPELYHAFSTELSLVFKSFIRFDSGEDQRTHWDIREANFFYLTNDYEFQAGIGKVFWGAAEFVHLVDIINQTDLVENINGEKKLGQPMLHLSAPKDWGVIDAFFLPFFRERTFPGAKDRLRTPLVVDTDQTIYEKGVGQYHADFALRYSNTFWENIDLGLYHFIGTSREPTLLPGGKPHSPIFVPYYEQISQTGMDLQTSAGGWLLKGEALFRSGQGRAFAAAVFGFEYTFFNIYDSGMDLGIIGEYVFDDRESDFALSSFNNDLMTGFRLALNDPAGTEILAGIMKDMQLSTSIFSIEASRRIGERIKLNIEALLIADPAEEDPAYIFKQDNYIKIEAVYFF